jgi:hypothetical protein
MLNKNAEYAIAGALALYIVFLTRPVPAPIVNLLSSPVAQVAALGVVVYVGATQSLLVAVVLAIAVVMSTPAREYLSMPDKAEKDKAAEQDAMPTPSKTFEDLPSPMKKMGKKATEPEKPMAAEKEPEHAGAMMSGKESFCVDNAAPF